MVPGNKYGMCKLCLNDKPLCASHIIPELCHKGIYDKKHRAIEGQFKNGKHHKRTMQKGFREYLLCSCCEGKLSKHERSFDKYWYGPDGLPDRIDGDALVLLNADYHTFKLFHLSIIWRASVSTAFSDISLGPHYDESIRKILRYDSPVPQSHYPIIGCVLTDDNGHIHPQVARPNKSKNGSSTCYTLSYAACDWVIIITDHPTLKQIELGETITTEGRITLLAMPFYKAPVGQATIAGLQQIRRENKG